MAESAREFPEVPPQPPRVGQALIAADPARALAPYGGYAAPAPADEGEAALSIGQLFAILRRRKWSIVLVLLLVVVSTLVGSFLATPIFRATTTLQIDRQAARVMNYQDVTPTDMDWWSRDFYQTQYDLMASRSLAERVVDQMGLSSDSNSNAKSAGLSAWLAKLFGGFSSAEPDPETSAERSARERAVATVQRSLTVAPKRDSRLVSMHYDSPNPQIAQAVANSLAQTFIDMNLERRFDASARAKTFLEGQLQTIRAKLEDSERELVDFARVREIVNVDDKQSINALSLKDVNAALVQAENARIEAQSEYDSLAGTNAGAAAFIDNPVIQQLKEAKAKLMADYQDKSKIYKPSYPRMQQIEGQIKETDEQIQAEIANVRAAVYRRYQAAQQKENALRAKLGTLKKDMLELQDRSVEYNTLKRAVDTNRQLYDGILQRVKELGVIAGSDTNNVSIVDKAQLPRFPHEPNIMRNALLAVFVGLVLGIALALLLERLDDSVTSVEDVERRFGLAVLGVIPQYRPGRDAPQARLSLTTHVDPTSGFAEAYRSLRTALLFSTSSGAPKTLVFTSARPGEGKSVSAISCAITFTQSGSKVLLIDADLRNPSVHRELSVENHSALTNYLTGDAKPAEISRATSVPGLFVIPSGPIPPNPVELLSGGRMLDLLTLAREKVDYVIVDGPPVLGLADALVLSGMADATALVIESGSTREVQVRAMLRRLRAVQHGTILGAVLTKVTQQSSSYGYGYEYDYHYQYGDTRRLTRQPGSARG